VECSLIGVVEAKQKEASRINRNDRLIAVAEQSLLYSEIRTLQDLNPQVLKQIEAFFVNYQEVRGVAVSILGNAGPLKAEQILTKARIRKKAA
jgi:inorganic pyrophosphatase